MEDRIRLLEELVACRSTEEVRARLSSMPWDRDGAGVTLRASDVANVLQRFVRGGLTAREVAEWAEALECREDVHVATSAATDLLFRLANPELDHPLTLETAAELLRGCGSGE